MNRGFPRHLSPDPWRGKKRVDTGRWHHAMARLRVIMPFDALSRLRCRNLTTARWALAGLLRRRLPREGLPRPSTLPAGVADAGYVGH